MKETKEEKSNSIIQKAKKIIKKEKAVDSKKEPQVNSRSTKSVKKVNSKSTESVKKVPTVQEKSPSKAKRTPQPKTFSEYYDLPYRYNQTVIKILAQTPHSLFIYWDISDNDRKEMTDKYGDNFFYETIPVLLVHNKTLNSNFEIEIDDFTNSWYLRTPTSNCVFEIELGRKKIRENDIIKFDNNSNIMHIAKSNTLESPNDHILKETLNTVLFRNVKNNQLEERNVSKHTVNNVYNLIELYNDNNEYENNPSSGFKIS